jgi:hypothetical protein
MRDDPEVAWTKARGVLAHFRSGVSSEQLVREIREGRDMSTPDNDAAVVERWCTDDDVERVAKTQWESIRANVGGPYEFTPKGIRRFASPSWNKLPDEGYAHDPETWVEGKTFHRKLARAALAAMPGPGDRDGQISVVCSRCAAQWFWDLTNGELVLDPIEIVCIACNDAAKESD